MKKMVFFLLSLLLLTGCNDSSVDVRFETIRVRVHADDWQYTQQDVTDQFNNNYYYAVVDMPELTADVFDCGEVKAYAVYDRWDTDMARKQLLPFVLHVEETNDKGEWYYYTQTIDFTYGIGWAMINFSRSDFLYEEQLTIAPPAMEFDIVISYPQK